jgi:hypothetical protein
MRAACCGASQRPVKKRVPAIAHGAHAAFFERETTRDTVASAASGPWRATLEEDESMTKAMVRLAWVLALTWPATGAAQYDWESGGGSPPTSDGAQPPPPAVHQASDAERASTATSSPETSGSSSAAHGDDHESVVGHLAVGYLGISAVPVATLAAANNINAPAIGVRYWFMDLVGLDVGLGIGYTSQVAAGAITAHDVFGMIVHAGVPIAPAHSEHFVFEITPEANFGFGSGNVPGAGAVGSTGLNGVLFQLGGRVGCELHFGFIGVPQLSLTASVGLYFTYQQASVNPPAGANTSEDLSTISTTVSGTPWQIFANTLNAFYYF